MRSGEEIQAALHALVGRWGDYSGTEKAEAQSFLNELTECYGADRQGAGMRFEHHIPGVGFVDLFWPGRALVEMKAPARSATLEQAQPQAERYWRASAAPDGSYDAVRYVVLCSFHRILVWDMHRNPNRPMVNLTLDELPEHYESLLFLAGQGQEPSFVEHHLELTRAAAEAIARLYQSLKDRSAAPMDEVQRFTMQCVWTLFAEDLGMVRGYPLQTIVARLLREPTPNPARDIGWLFSVLNQKGQRNRLGELSGTTYVNGELFREPAAVDLDRSELQLLESAARFDWRRVDPTIFGSLMEGVLGRERRWELGAHYTHEADILKIVGPTIVRPWTVRIDACTTAQQARDLLDELCAFKVLDPACGCGNFLYVAYRELRALEALLKARIRSLAAETGLSLPELPWPYVPLANMQGIDIERVAVLIARVTLWMGHRQMIELYGEAEHPLPLVDLSGVRAGDALRIEWPETDVIIGNPPFLGSQHLRGAFGDEYVAWLQREFGVGVKDFCVYWFRRAHDHLRSGQRAGLVGTNSVSQNRARSASLQYVTGTGGVITDAVSSQKWPGEAKVHVSLVNWVRVAETDEPRMLDGVVVEHIDAALHAGAASDWQPATLSANAGRCFQGPIPVGAGFILTADEAKELLARDDADYREVVRPYLTGEDIAQAIDQGPRRWIIDFNEMRLEDAHRFPAALAVVRARVKPERDVNRDNGFRSNWWLFGRPRGEMRHAVAGRSRWLGSLAFGKRLLLSWQDAWTSPSGKIYVFAFDDDYSMGVLTSRAHGAWARYRGGTLETRLSYTPTSVFMTFPWPDPVTAAQREAVAEACRRLLTRRSELCSQNQVGLTTVYNAMDEGAYADLKALHRTLDEAVAASYGWPRAVAQDDSELVRRLTARNREIVEGARPYAPFAHLAPPAV